MSPDALKPLIVHIQRGVPYDVAERWQQETVDLLAGNPDEPNRLFVLELEPVVTVGRRAKPEHLLVSPEELERRGVAFRRVARGGDITWHGPGQWTLYPVARLRHLGGNLRGYLRGLEGVAIRWLRGHGVEGVRREGLTGVWVGSGKIAAVGVAVTRWIAWHGMAANVRVDPEPWGWMVPCGIPSGTGGVTGLEAVAGRSCDMDAEGLALARCFAEEFGFGRLSP